MTLYPKLQVAEQLIQAFRSIRQQSLDICSPLQPEDYVVQPALDASPPKWHLGHTTWFFENFILVDFLDDYECFDKSLNFIFNSYYESQGPRILRTNRGNISRPALGLVLDYRTHVDNKMDQVLRAFAQSAVPKKLYNLLILGLQHEQQHQELLVTDIKYLLGHNPYFPAYREDAPFNEVAEAFVPEFLSIPEGIYEIGHRGDAFCFDNELGAHKVFLHDFEIRDTLVTNAEYLEFIQAGGYEQFELWLSEGWEWTKQLDVKAPEYWFEKDGAWWHYTLTGAKKVDPAAPVTHVSYFEADAFARWKGLRLPTEFEWEAACNTLYEEIPEDSNFLEQKHFHPTAKKEAKDYQMLGNVWEWTGSAYLAYPRYPRLEGALGEYNGKFMVNQMVLRGGSCATPISHIRPTYRNFFHTNKRWQFTGIRLAR